MQRYQAAPDADSTRDISPARRRVSDIDPRRRQWLLAGSLLPTFPLLPTPLRAAPSAAAAALAPAPIALSAPAPLARLHVDATGTLLAVSRGGELWTIGGAGWQKLGDGLDPAVPLATGHGRVAGRSRAGGAWILEAGRLQVIDRPLLAPHAGLLILAFGLIAVTVGDDGVQRVVRLDPDGAGWAESARGRMPVLPDARPLQFDPDGPAVGADADGNGHVVVFGAPSERYRHAVLGDAIEPTALMLLERHGLEPMAGIALPPPHVFEDIAPRPIAWRGQRALLTMRAGPLGAQLCVVARSAGAANRFELAALGEPIGIPNRWLSPSTDGRRLLAVVTPHLGGVLHRYEPEGDRLPSRIIARGLSNHALGQRELDVSAWIGPRWVVPTPERRRLLVFDVASAEGTQATRPVELSSPVVELKAWRRGPDTGVAVLLEDGSAWWVGVSA